MPTTTMTGSPPTDTGRCGSPAGHKRHRRRGELPCQPCLTALRDAARDWRLQRLGRLHVRPDLTGARPLSDRSVFGRFAGLQTMHRARLRGGQCVECFGWPDDPRHPVVDLGPWKAVR